MEPTSPLPSLKPNRSSAEELGSFKIIHVDPGSGDKSLHTVNSKSTSEYKIVYYEARQTNRHKTPSEVWKYFALATKDTSVSVNSDELPDDRILCMLCYSKGRVHVYKSKTSSSNLWKHLSRKHNIELPSEKMFAIPSTKYEVYDFEGDVDEVGEGLVENSQEANSTDDQLSAVDVDDTEQIVIKADDFGEGSGFQMEEVVERPMEENFQNGDAIVKLESNSTGPVFKDIGLIIIEEVSKRPVLYDMLSNKSPSVRANREMMWAEVYEALGEIIQVDRIQKIWKNIKERYKKLRNAEKNGLSDCSKKYKYYNQLRFLDDCSTFDQSSDNSLDEPPEKKFRTEDLSYPSFMMEHDNLPYTVDEFDQHQQNYITEEVVQDSNCTVSSSNPPIRNTLCPIEIIQSTFDDTTIKHSPTSSPFNQSEQVDEFDLFGKLIAKKLRAAPRERVNLIEIKIMQAIHENS